MTWALNMNANYSCLHSFLVTVSIISVKQELVYESSGGTQVPELWISENYLYCLYCDKCSLTSN